MDTSENTITVRKGKPVQKFSLYLFFTGFAAFVLGIGFGQGVIGGVGFVAMTLGAILMQSSIWAKVANRRSVRCFRSISQVVWRNTDGPEYTGR